MFDLLGRLLIPHGFVKKKDTWYLYTPECISFISFGKSPYSGRYEHVMGCFVLAINEGINEYPKFNMNNLAYNLEDFVGREEVRRIFNLENTEFKKDEREVLIGGMIEKLAIPFLKEISSIAGIRGALKKHEDLQYHMKAELREYLGIVVD